MTVSEEAALRLHREAGASRWNLSMPAFRAALDRSAAKSGADDVERYCASLHLADLALACACAEGDEAAWEHFVLEYRPTLYRAAAAIDRSGGARDLADGIHAELFGLRERDGERQSLFRYFHGRSSLATWLRAVLSQRHVDRIRGTRREEPLPENEERLPRAATSADPDHGRFAVVIHAVLMAAIDGLAPRDRLRLGWYYAGEMTLARIGRMLGEHEATVSRHLSRTRKTIRESVERALAREHGLAPGEIDECLAAAVEDPGDLDLARLLTDNRKTSALDRSTSEGTS